MLARGVMKTESIWSVTDGQYGENETVLYAGQIYRESENRSFASCTPSLTTQNPRPW